MRILNLGFVERGGDDDLVHIVREAHGYPSAEQRRYSDTQWVWCSLASKRGHIYHDRTPTCLRCIEGERQRLVTVVP